MTDDATGDDEARNTWDFEHPPDPSLSFHGDLPTDPGPLLDRPTGPPPGTPLPPPAPGPPGAPSPPPPVAPTPPPSPRTEPPPTPPISLQPDTAPGQLPPPKPLPPLPTRAPTKVAGKTAFIVIGVAAVMAGAIVVGLVLSNGDDGEVVTSSATPTPETETGSASDTGSETGSASDTDSETKPTATPGDTDTTEVATMGLPRVTTTWGAEVTESWRLEGDQLTVTTELASSDGDAAAGVHVVFVPKSVATDVDDITFEPSPDEVVEIDPVVAFEIDLAAGDEPVSILWSATVEVDEAESPDAAINRFVADRDVLRDEFLAGDGPALVISAPVSDRPVVGQIALAEGTTDPGSTVTVDGRAVIVAPDGAWTGGVDRTARRQTIVVVATDRFGRSTEVRVRVRFENPTPTPAPTPTPRPVTVATPRPTTRPQPVPTAAPTVCPPTEPDCR